ncbi:guanine nucleotide exchange factor in Golgi transport N-terminal-domain-containing protein [Mycena floridula]|nr:guanine nucleotide exchange factor in Golgi transport N-terminal-domain-containing protein [Mycena floridula]
MSSLAFLVTELQSLSSETRRKHPEVREAAEKSLAILRASPEQATVNLASDGPQSDDLLRPVFMGCATKNAKVVAISIGSLQRLIALKAVPQSAVALIINTMSDAMSQGVDIQLRILQTLLSLLTNFSNVHGVLLGEALLLCFKLHESKIAVVSSTAAATLRQLVMFVVDKMVEEDNRDEKDNKEEIKLPDGTTRNLGPSSRDAFSIFEDLCLLANSERPNFLKLEFLHKTFALELIESVLTNYHDLFRKHSELILLLRHHLCPLLMKALSDRPIFPLTLRCTRVVFLLLKQFSRELETESEVFLVLLIKIIVEEGDGIQNEQGSGYTNRPQWMRVLAMEIIRGLCSDAELLRNFWDRYDSQESGASVFGNLITGLKRLVTEKPALLGVGSQMSGVGVPSDTSSEYGGMAGMVATAASGVVGMIGSGAGLSSQGSAMRIQCIDQLDKADSPPIPETYIYLLGVQCLVSLCEGFASFTGPLYNTLVVQKQGAIRAPPSLDLSSLEADDPSTKQLLIVRSMIETGWPALLAALSFVIATNLSDEIFVDVLASYQAMTNVSGMLGLTTPRDAFFNSLSKFAVPTRVVSGLDDTPKSPVTPTSFSENLGRSVSDNLGLTGPSQNPSLSERNLACLKVLISSAMFLAGNLDESWFGVMEHLQNAEYVLTLQQQQQQISLVSPKRVATRPAISGSQQQQRHPLLMDLEVDTMLGAIQRLFDSSKNLEDEAFKHFVDSLCRLSSEMVGMQQAVLETEEARPSHHRRLSGIHIPRATIRSGDFGITKLGGIALLNIHRLIYRPPEIAWTTTTTHLLAIIRLALAPQAIRIQAARVLDDILVVVPRNINNTGSLQSEVQRRVFDVLSSQIMPEGTLSSTTSVELRKMGLETLHQILESSGHTLVVGWETIFAMLGSVCSTPPLTRSNSADLLLSPRKPVPLGLGAPSEKSWTGLIKIAFQSLTLVCDSVSLLAPEHLRLCISTLGQFGKQADTNIALTAAASLLWSVSDAIQSKRKGSKEGLDEDVEEYNEIWMVLLLEVLGLCQDKRPEVRDGAIQTLFRTMQLYGGTLSLDTWDQCIWKVTFPLLDALTTMRRPEDDSKIDESKILAWHSIGSLYHDFLHSKIGRLETFGKSWDVFVKHIEDACLEDDRSINCPALRCLEKAIKASTGLGDNGVWERVWQTIDRIGEAVLTQSALAFTQETLVAYVDVIQCTRTLSRAIEGKEWPLDRLTRLMAILKGVLTYSSSPDYRPDIDQLPALQALVMDTIANIDLTTPGSPSLVMRDLSEFATLAFLAAFDLPAESSNHRRITYIALSKKTMPLLVEYFLRFKDQLEIYVDETLEAVLSAYSIPVKLKYDCPAPSKFGKDPPLWKTATTSFLKIVRECASQLKILGADIPSERMEGIWRQVIDVFRGGILADCSAAEAFALDKQESEETFDLALIGALEIDVVPHLGDSRVSDGVVSQLSKVLQQGSRLYDSSHQPSTDSSPRDSLEFVKVHHGSTEHGLLLPRERFSYWCFDLLFLICSNTTNDQEPARRRLAALSLPSLLSRCRSVMVGYVADESLRGNLPFPRAREDELLYVLRKLLELRLWSGSLWAALSDNPSAHCVTQPAIGSSSSPSVLIADSVKRSSVAHLFHFYPTLCEIASIPRRAPSSWVQEKGAEPVELDARVLARRCLKEVGREMGV